MNLLAWFRHFFCPTPDETLTLYTCSGFADSKRLIVTAKRLPEFDIK